eukprot:Filipodium_phascolosomae@DN4533_c0_g1_i1.p1
MRFYFFCASIALNVYLVGLLMYQQPKQSTSYMRRIRMRIRKNVSKHFKTFYVTSFSNLIPNYDPYDGHPIVDDMKKLGYRFKYINAHLENDAFFEEIDGLIFNNVEAPYEGILKKIRKADQPGKFILLVWEPPSVMAWLHDPSLLATFGTVLTYNDTLVDGKKFLKFHYDVWKPVRPNLPAFRDRKLVCMVNDGSKSSIHYNELYSLRHKVAGFFEKLPGDQGLLDLYGKGWNGYPRGDNGHVDDKLETLSRYKFTFSIENCNSTGYITEKIFDPMATGSIPIYIGAPNILEYVPSRCFVDMRKFPGLAELVDHLTNFTEEQYNEHFSCIKEFLSSDAAKQFSWATNFK